MELQIMYLINVEDKESGRINVRQVVKSIDPRIIFGDDLPEIGQIHAFYVKLPWQNDAILEFLPRPIFLERMGF